MKQFILDLFAVLKPKKDADEFFYMQRQFVKKYYPAKIKYKIHSIVECSELHEDVKYKIISTEIDRDSMPIVVRHRLEVYENNSSFSDYHIKFRVEGARVREEYLKLVRGPQPITLGEFMGVE